MVRNRHRKPTPPTAPAVEAVEKKPLTPAAQKIADQMMDEHEEGLQERILHVLLDSGRLADEPEFSSFTLNPQKTLDISSRWHKKSAKRLKLAKNRGEEQYQEAFDDVRIEIIKELFGPALRRDVLNRLQALMDRIMQENDVETLKMIMYLFPVLKANQVPWGVCTLVINLYNRALQAAVKEPEEEIEELYSILDELVDRSNGNLEIEDFIKNPDKLEEIEEEILRKKPDLLERIENKTWEMVKDFEERLFKGEIKLDLFSEEELVMPFVRLREQTGTPLLQLEESNENQNLVAEQIDQAIRDIMTPARMRKMRQDLERVVQIWKRKRNRWAGVLNYELELLEDKAYEEAPFFFAAFIGQIQRQKITGG